MVRLVRLAAVTALLGLGPPGCAGPEPALLEGPAFVDVLDEGVARVVPFDGRAAFTVRADALPKGTGEGDVFVHGRLDPEAKRALVEELRLSRARHLVHVLHLEL